VIYLMIKVWIMVGNVWHAYGMNKEVYDEFKKWLIYEDADIMKKFQYLWFNFIDKDNQVYIFRNHIQFIRVV